MKKFLAFIAVVTACFLLTACTGIWLDEKQPTEGILPPEGTYTDLEDGTVLYENDTLSVKSTLQFTDMEGNVLVDGSHVQTVAAKWSQQNQYYLEIEFNQEGTTAFATATANNIGKSINIVLDGTVLSEPTVNEAITNGVVCVASYESYEDLMEIYTAMVE